jgi:hypothetical protein
VFHFNGLCYLLCIKAFEKGNAVWCTMASFCKCVYGYMFVLLLIVFDVKTLWLLLSDYRLQAILVNQRLGHEKGRADLFMDRLIVLCLCDFYICLCFSCMCDDPAISVSYGGIPLFVSDPFLEVLLSRNFNLFVLT